MIYTLKIYLFRSQFQLTTTELSGLQQFNAFVVKLYLKAWYTCMSSTSAPRNDLQLLKDLTEYIAVNKRVACEARRTLMRHLWYLSETLVGLAFFDCGIADAEKLRMVAALSKPGEDSDLIRVQSVDENNISTLSLSDFVSSNTNKFFAASHIETDFLQQHPSSWGSSDVYQISCDRVKRLKVVNDAAERGVALIQNFNSILTNQEEQKQYLLQVVEHHRQQFPMSKKSIIVDKLSSD